MNADQITIGYIKEYIRGIIIYLKKKMIYILGSALICAIMGVTYSVLKKTRYEAEISFFLNEKEVGMANAFTSFAGQFLNVESNWPNEDKIKDLMFTRRILGTNLLTPIEVDGQQELMINYFISVNRLNESFVSDTILKGFEKFTAKSVEKLTFQENYAMNAIIAFIKQIGMIKIGSTTKETLVGSKGGGIITISVQTKSEVLSREFTINLVKILSEFYVQKSIQRETENYALISSRADSILSVMESKEEDLAMFNDQSYGLVKSVPALTKLRLQRDLQILSVMYAEVMKNKEALKFSMSSKTPLFQVIDSPEYPLSVIKPSKLNNGLIGFLVGFILTCVFFVFKRTFLAQ